LNAPISGRERNEAKIFLNDPFSLVGRNAVVTGGSGGIGKMMARALIDRGCRVYIAGRSEARLKSSVEELDLAGRSGDFVAGKTIAVDGGLVRATATHGFGYGLPLADPP
jgi:shikimate 5-dehydrogenase